METNYSTESAGDSSLESAYHDPETIVTKILNGIGNVDDPADQLDRVMSAVAMWQNILKLNNNRSLREIDFLKRLKDRYPDLAKEFLDEDD